MNEDEMDTFQLPDNQPIRQLPAVSPPHALLYGDPGASKRRAMAGVDVTLRMAGWNRTADDHLISYAPPQGASQGDIEAAQRSVHDYLYGTPPVYAGKALFSQTFDQPARGTADPAALTPLTLSATSMFSKFGFDDGDALLVWLDENTGRDGVGAWSLLYTTCSVTTPAGWLPNDAAALRELVQDHLVPLLPSAEVVEHDTHNPVRCRPWWGDDQDIPEAVRNVHATVSGEDVLAALAAASRPE